VVLLLWQNGVLVAVNAKKQEAKPTFWVQVFWGDRDQPKMLRLLIISHFILSSHKPRNSKGL
jgi:hypothetical protein